MSLGGCQTTLAGNCLGIPRFNAIMATWLFAAAALVFHQWWLEVSAGE